LPVLITLATINALSRPGSEAVSMLNPGILQARCMEAIEDTEIREQAVMLTAELQQLTQRYQNAVAESLDAYLTKSAEWDSSADDLIEILEPLDILRIQTLQDIVQVRLLMREILTAEQWDNVFG
jgi:hypothetical protein